MKTKIKTFVIVALISIPLAMFAQGPPHPNGGNAPNPSTNTPVPGGGAPIGGGLVIMMALAAAYGTRKVTQSKRSSKINEII